MVIAGEIVNVVSAYAPQSGETEKIKEEFLKNWEDLMSRVLRTVKIVVGADLNGHVGKNPGVFQRVHGGKGYGHRNRENLGKHGEPTLGTSKHFLQHKGRTSDHL